LNELNKNKPLNEKRIGIFGKGGAGKSTITYLLSNGFLRNQYTPIVLDADSTNLCLSRIFQIQRPPRPLIDYFGGTVFHGGRVTCPVDDPAPLEGAVVDLNSLDDEFFVCNPHGIYFFSVGKIGGEGPGAGCDGPVAKIARDFRVKVHTQNPVTLIDFKAGLEDIARGVITSLDLVLFVVDVNLVSVEMAANIQDIVRNISLHKMPATAHLKDSNLVNWANRYYQNAHIAQLRFILNKIASIDEEKTITRLLEGKGIFPSCIIKEDSSIKTAWLNGTQIELKNNDSAIQSLVASLERDIKYLYQESE